MKKLNIVGKKVKAAKWVKLNVFDSSDAKPDTLYTLTDGRGNYTLSNDNSIFYTDKEGTTIRKDWEIHGNPKKLYKGKPQLSVAEVNGKLGVYDLAILVMVEGPYDDIDALVEDVCGEEDILGLNIKYLDFNFDQG